MIKVENLSKKYGSKLAVDNLSFEVEPGKVTGFLGPNGSGKSTTMRLIVGLDRPTSGQTFVNSMHFSKFKKPMSEVGILLDAGYVHPTRTARNHLRAMAASNGIPLSRVEEVLELVGLTEVAKKRVGKFSLGMKQRVGLAGTLLGDPKVIILDEPGNGLDPEGIRWIREFLSFLAGEGRTVFVSSHLLSEMALMADDLVVIGQGKLIARTTVAEMTTKATGGYVGVRSPNAEVFRQKLIEANIKCELKDDELKISGMTIEQAGNFAFVNQIELHELTQVQPSLEDAFLQMTANSQEYKTHSPVAGEQGGSK